LLPTIQKLRALLAKVGDDNLPPGAVPGIEPIKPAEPPAEKAAPVPIEEAKEAPDVNEYLEQVLSDFHKREVDQEENVARSLPFMGTSLAVLSGLIGVVRTSIPMFSLSHYFITVYSIISFLSLYLLAMLRFLWIAVRPRRFKTTLTADEFYETYQRFKAYYEPRHLSPAEMNAAIINDLREGLISNYAEVATRNRGNNLARIGARAHAFQCLVFALFLACCLVGAIMVHDQVLSVFQPAELPPYYGID
jgi:hypothetical protein